MLSKLLKEEYETWKTDPSNTDNNQFINMLVTERNADPVAIKQVLEQKDWYRLNE